MTVWFTRSFKTCVLIRFSFYGFVSLFGQTCITLCSARARGRNSFSRAALRPYLETPRPPSIGFIILTLFLEFNSSASVWLPLTGACAKGPRDDVTGRSQISGVFRVRIAPAPSRGPHKREEITKRFGGVCVC